MKQNWLELSNSWNLQNFFHFVFGEAPLVWRHCFRLSLFQGCLVSLCVHCSLDLKGACTLQPAASSDLLGHFRTFKGAIQNDLDYICRLISTRHCCKCPLNTIGDSWRGKQENRWMTAFKHCETGLTLGMTAPKNSPPGARPSIENVCYTPRPHFCCEIKSTKWH